MATVLEEVFLGILPPPPASGPSLKHMDEGKNLRKLKSCEEGIWLGRLTTQEVGK